ncbi:MAG: OB-fold domain-containing protein [Euryarchaeota archaeon]|nr:OB-fold domain-containing protein [Euryarchaeota archaeon]
MADYPLPYAQYAESLKAGKLKGLKCGGCGAMFATPRIVCTSCGAPGKLQPHEFQGAGTVQTWTFVRVPPLRYQAKQNYVIGVVKLQEGPSVMGILQVEAEKVIQGMRVQLAPVMFENEVQMGFKAA